MKRKIAITANRDITPKDEQIIRAKMDALVNDSSVAEIWFGGARGGDTVALKWAFMLEPMDMDEDLDRPLLIVVVPDTVEKQPKETHIFTAVADKIIELKNPITKSNNYKAYHIRNQYLVDNTDEVIAFTDGNLKSGTMSCVRYAENKGKKADIVELEGVK